MQRFADRRAAGLELAVPLQRYRGRDVVVAGLPRGGVPVAFEVAEALGAPLDVLVVRKLGVPAQPELAFGAIGEGGVRLLNQTVLSHVRVSEKDIAAVEAVELAELRRRVERYRGDRARIPLVGRTALIVDDGFATGSTVRAATMVARAQGAAKVIVAAPVGASDTVAELRRYADDVVCLGTPVPFFAVGSGYRSFPQNTDEEVCGLLEQARAE
jgi:predicted phosphoribosyltransferase